MEPIDELQRVLGMEVVQVELPETVEYVLRGRKNLVVVYKSGMVLEIPAFDFGFRVFPEHQAFNAPPDYTLDHFVAAKIRLREALKEGA